jgi:large subunit ribosomal protein L10
MVKQSKMGAVESLADKFNRAKSVVLTDFRGLTVGDVTILRSNLRAEKVEYRVVKNRLAQIALQKAGCDSLDELLTGPTGIAFGYHDPVPAARIIFEFTQKYEHLKLKGGLLEGKRIDLPTIEKLSKLPPKDQLLGKLMGSLQSPTMKFVFALRQVGTSLVCALKALEEQKKGASIN